MNDRIPSQALAFNAPLAETGPFCTEASPYGAFPAADGRTRVRLRFPETVNSVVLRGLDGTEWPLENLHDGSWGAQLDLPAGFLYVTPAVDGAEVISPDLCIGYGACRTINFIDVPEAGDEAWQLREDIPHGAVVRRYFPSAVTGHTESCLVYEPPCWDRVTPLPVLYLQHGYGENETGWVYQGRMNYILDNLLHEGACVPMLVVMCNGMVRIGGRADTTALPRLLLTDVIPYIEGSYPVLTDKEHRAMAGLSMGSMHTSMTVLSHPELFAWAGIFSGFLRHLWQEEQPHLAILEKPDELAASFRYIVRAMGTEDVFLDRFAEDDALLAARGVTCIDRILYPGAHEWQVWRKCLRDFMSRVFRA